jgi:hypothetical protein
VDLKLFGILFRTEVDDEASLRPLHLAVEHLLMVLYTILDTAIVHLFRRALFTVTFTCKENRQEETVESYLILAVLRAVSVESTSL